MKHNIKSSIVGLTIGSKINKIIESYETTNLKQIEDKISWLRSMREILEHNHRVFLSIGDTASVEHQEITKYYTNYFQNIK